MTRRATMTQAELERAIRAAKAQGCIVRLRPGGEADILPADPAAPEQERPNSCDAVFGREL
jgi:hypothetical protein